jgi:hypothetical protein
MRPVLTRLAVIAAFFVLGTLAMATGTNLALEAFGIVVFAWLGWIVVRRVRDMYEDT